MAAATNKKHSDFWAFELVVIVGLAIFSAAGVTISGILRWWESAIIAGALVIVVIALLWSIDEVKWLNRH